MKKITESTSNHEDLDKKSTEELLLGINSEDKKVALAVEKEMHHIKAFINAAFTKMSEGGRLFYIGAGTSGRLGVVDASECPPTFGVDHGLVNGIIAGGDHAIRKAVEFAEDSDHLGWEDFCEFNITKQDVIVGIAASGTTPYVIGAIKKAEDKKNDLTSRQKRKKVKRLERKVAKITATEKMAEEKKKPKKERKSATEA